MRALTASALAAATLASIASSGSGSSFDAAELWLADDGLFVVDMLAATLEEISLVSPPSVMPSGDLVFDDGRATGLVFFDPDARAETARASLPLPP